MNREIHRVCFLLGLPRSGTTLLANLLQQHPEIAAPPEPWLMLALQAFGTVDHRHPAGGRLIRAATSEFLGRIDRTLVCRALADAAYGQYLALAGKRLLLDKTPRNWLVLDFLESVYPRSPQILLMRNPYAIAASLKTTWGIPLESATCPPAIASCLADLALGQPAGAVASSLADLVLGLPVLAAHRGRSQTLVVHYEGLVTRTEAEISHLTSWLGCEPVGEPSVTAKVDELPFSLFGDRKILERRTTDGRSVQAWRDELSVEEMQAVTDLVGTELLTHLGYGEDLWYAQRVGVVDKGPQVTAEYRAIFRGCLDFLNGSTAPEGLSAESGEQGDAIQRWSDNVLPGADVSIANEAKRLVESKREQRAQLVSLIAARLHETLSC